MKILRNIVGEQQKLMSQNAEAALHDCVKNRLYMRQSVRLSSGKQITSVVIWIKSGHENCRCDKHLTGCKKTAGKRRMPAVRNKAAPPARQIKKGRSPLFPENVLS